MAIDPGLVDLDAANAELPPFPEVTNQAPVHTAFFFSAPGSVHRATKSGTWGDAREASVEYGQRYLDVVTEATVRSSMTSSGHSRRCRRAERAEAETQAPARMTRRTERSSSSSTMSARWPTARRPRSVMPSSASGARVAAATAAGIGTPASTSLRTATSRAMTEPARVVVPARVTRSPRTSTSARRPAAAIARYPRSPSVADEERAGPGGFRPLDQWPERRDGRGCRRR